MVRPAGERVWYPAERDVHHCPDARRYLGARHCRVARRYPVCPVTADPGASDAVAGWAAEVAAAPRVAAEDSAESAVWGAEAAAAGAPSSSAAHKRAGLGSSGPNSRRW